MYKMVYLLAALASAAIAREPEAQLPFDYGHAPQSAVVHLHTTWDSRYSLEGRDSLDGDALLATSFELGWGRFTGGLWHGVSPGQHYAESRATLGLTEAVGDFELYAAYTYLQFQTDHFDDNEIGIGGSWTGLPLALVLAVDGYYSFDAGGSFWAFELNREVVISERFTLTGSGVFGVNQGYVADGHDGENYVALRLVTEYVVTSSFAISAHATYSWAMARDENLPGDDQLINFFHGGLGLRWSF